MISCFGSKMVNKGYNLGCAEFAVPGDTLEDKLQVLEEHEMWLELVNDGLDNNQLQNISGALTSSKTEIISVQAYLLHDLSMLSGDYKDQKLAIDHVEKTLKIASDVGAKNIVTVATYGTPTIPNPMERCINIFKHFGKLGAEFDITVSIEALSRDKTTFLPNVPEVYNIVQAIDSEYVRLMADTLHIHSNGENAADIINEYAAEIMELHLRDTNSRPPGKGSIEFNTITEIVCKKFKGLLCLEYQPGDDPYKDFKDAYNFIYGVR